MDNLVIDHADEKKKRNKNYTDSHSDTVSSSSSSEFEVASSSGQEEEEEDDDVVDDLHKEYYQKQIRLHQQYHYDLVGSVCHAYFLEKSRVIPNQQQHSKPYISSNDGHDDHHDDGISSDGSNEQSFHIFYQLLNAPSKVQKAYWKGLMDKTPNDFTYLSGSTETATSATNKNNNSDNKEENHEMNNEQSLLKTIHGLNTLGIRSKQLKYFLQAICAVLQMGNIIFEKSSSSSSSPSSSSTIKNGKKKVSMHLPTLPLDDDEKNDDGCSIHSMDELKALSELLGISSTTLQNALTEKSTMILDEPVIVPLRPEIAKQNLDSLAKELYGAMFSWLIQTINDATSSSSKEELERKNSHSRKGNVHGDDDSGPVMKKIMLKGQREYESDLSNQASSSSLKTIGLLDFFGFEAYDHGNSFEQLCINFANELLQSKFNDDIFGNIHLEYKEEDLSLDELYVDFPSNQNILDLFDTPLIGLMPVLNEECILPRGNDEAFLRKAISNVNDKPQLRKVLYSKVGFQDYEFGIRHFAADVVYDCRSFLSKNQERLPWGLVELLVTKSSNPIIALGMNGGANNAGEIQNQQHQHSSPSRVQSRKSLAKTSSSRSSSSSPKITRRSYKVPSSPRAPSSPRISYSPKRALSPRRSYSPRPMSSISNSPKMSSSPKAPSSPKINSPRSVRRGLRGSAMVAKTVWSKYRFQLGNLMDALDECKSFYIRCIKPNSQKAAAQMEHKLVLNQLRSSGILSALTMARKSFPNSLPNRDVLGRFEYICTQLNVVDKRRRNRYETKSEPSFADSIRKDIQRGKVETLLSKALYSLRKKEKDGTYQKAFVVGKKTTYFVAGALEFLEDIRSKGSEACAISIQSFVRGYNVRKHWSIRSFRVRNEAVRSVQSWYRATKKAIGKKHRQKEEKIKKSCVQLQSFFRVSLARIAMQKKEDSKKTEKRKRQQERRMRILRIEAAIMIQAAVRGMLQRGKYSLKIHMSRKYVKLCDEVDELQYELEKLQSAYDESQYKHAREIEDLEKLQKKESVEYQMEIFNESSNFRRMKRSTSLRNIMRQTSMRSLKTSPNILTKHASLRNVLGTEQSQSDASESSEISSGEVEKQRKANKKLRKQIFRTDKEIQVMKANIATVRKSNQDARKAVLDAKNVMVRLTVNIAKVQKERDVRLTEVGSLSRSKRTRVKQYEIERQSRMIYLKTMKKVVKIVNKKKPNTVLATEVDRIASVYVSTESRRRPKAMSLQDSFSSITSVTELADSDIDSDTNHDSEIMF